MGRGPGFELVVGRDWQRQTEIPGLRVPGPLAGWEQREM